VTPIRKPMEGGEEGAGGREGDGKLRGDVGENDEEEEQRQVPLDRDDTSEERKGRVDGEESERASERAREKEREREIQLKRKSTPSIQTKTATTTITTAARGRGGSVSNLLPASASSLPPPAKFPPPCFPLSHSLFLLHLLRSPPLFPGTSLRVSLALLFAVGQNPSFRTEVHFLIGGFLSRFPRFFFCHLIVRLNFNKNFQPAFGGGDRFPRACTIFVSVSLQIFFFFKQHVPRSSAMFSIVSQLAQESAYKACDERAKSKNVRLIAPVAFPSS